MAEIRAQRYSLAVLCCNVCFLSKLSDNCPDGWKEFEGFCYKFYLDRKRSFTEAVATCRQIKAELLVVNSMEENRFIEEQIASDDYVWLGMIRHSGLDASWELLNGEEPTFNLMDDYRHRYSSYGSPYGSPGEEYCALLIRKHGWHDVECETRMEGVAVCKRPFSE